MEKAITIKQALHKATEALKSQGIEEASLEAEILLRHILGLSRTELYIRLEEGLSLKQVQELNRLVRRRLNHEPIAYITETKEFYGLDFYVNPRVFIPRPETELLVEQVLKMIQKRPRASCLIADVGTGSGAIAISLAVNLPQAKIYAVDLSPLALEVAAMNCRKHEVTAQVHLLQGNLLEPLPEPVDFIVANLPYVSDLEMNKLSDEIRRFEPLLALSGGRDGLKVIRPFLAQAKAKLRGKGTILLEIAPEKREAVIQIAAEQFPEATVEVIPDLSGHERVIAIQNVKC